MHPREQGVVVRNTQSDDISKIVDLQKESFPYLARYGNIWHPEELKSHLRIFPQGQFVAVEPDGLIVGSASTLMVSLNPEYAAHAWKEITANGMFTNHNSNGDSLYGADISTHPKHRHEGIGGMLYEARKKLGSDWPICDMGSYLKFVQKLDLGQRSFELLMFKNAKRIFGL
jgi:ribosomal protein S18 acetylase RimI-like enzyme